MSIPELFVITEFNCINIYLKLFLLIYKQFQDVNRLLRACELGDEDGLQVLLDSGYEVNAKDENGTTPLQVAAANDHVNCLEIFL
jgi:ankyrin repeat protein